MSPKGIPGLQLVVETWYADDQYPTPDIGISDGKDYGYDASVNFALDSGVNGHDVNGHAFITQQYILAAQTVTAILITEQAHIASS
ncbi:MtrB/PioB family outer membrane beta-barrel protein [Vibrio sp. ABG19]|nr:MtrB/PioB family outer membrane beta-barrel protein [Vibrio sp. ABG19]